MTHLNWSFSSVHTTKLVNCKYANIFFYLSVDISEFCWDIKGLEVSGQIIIYSIVIRNGNSLETRAVSYCFTCSSENLNIGPMILYKIFTERPPALKKYMNCWRNVNFNKELDAVTSTEEIDDKKKYLKCVMCGKEFVSSRGLKRHATLKHVQEEVTPKEQEKCSSP